MEIKIRHRWTNDCLWSGDIEDSGSQSINMGRAVKAALLMGANLTGANLMGASLMGANLTGANLRCANLRGADLMGANLRGADLMGANLTGANLRYADLRGANLTGADLRCADLTGADLMGANLRGAGKISALSVLTGLYGYQCMAFVTDSGAPWVRMGCLWQSVEEWDRITIRASNTIEFPDDGSARCEERVRAFEFVRDMALRMASEWAANNQKKES